MAQGGYGLANEVFVGGIRADFEVFGPSNLAKLADMHGFKKSDVRQSGKHPAPNVPGQVKDALNAIGIDQTKTEAR